MPITLESAVTVTVPTSPDAATPVPITLELPEGVTEPTLPVAETALTVTLASALTKPGKVLSPKRFSSLSPLSSSTITPTGTSDTIRIPAVKS